MDPISCYFTKTKSFSVHILYNAFYRLHVIQLPHLCFTYSQIQQTLEVILDSVDSSEDVDRTEQVMMYSGVFYEACTLTKMTSQGAALVFRKGIEEHPEKKIALFVEQTLKERQEKEPEIYDGVLQELDRQTSRLFKEKASSTPKPVKTEEVSLPPPVLPPPPAVPEEPTTFANALVPPIQSHPPAPPGLVEINKIPSKDENDEDENIDIADGSIERNESMIKFLAHIRKSGMDIILPQHMHDKLLLTLYIATKVAAPLAHRQLMDMVLAAKQARVLVNDLEIVSKTKIRGILALLKNAHSLYTSGGNGESVRLYLGKGVVNYRTFREKHDSFISRCILQQHIFLPIAIKAEVLWTGDEQTITEKCAQLEKLEPILEEYFVIGKTATNPPRTNSTASVKRTLSTTNQSLRSDGSFWGIESLTSANGANSTNGVFRSNNSLSPIAFAVANADNRDLTSLDVSPARSTSLIASLGGLTVSGPGLDEKDSNYYNPFNNSVSGHPGSSSFAAIDNYHSFRPAFDESLLRSPSPDNSLSFSSSISDRNSIFVPSNMNLPASSSASNNGRGGIFDFFSRGSNGTNSSFSSHTLSTTATNTTRGSSSTTFDLNSTANSFSVDGRYSSEVHSMSNNNNNRGIDGRDKSFHPNNNNNNSNNNLHNIFTANSFHNNGYNNIHSNGNNNHKFQQYPK